MTGLVAEKAHPDTVEVPGPNGISLVMSSPEFGYYSKAEVKRSGHPAVHLAIDPHSVIDAEAVEGDNGLFRFKLRQNLPWSLRVWSIDGQYAVLTLYRVIDNKVDARNGHYAFAFDLSTGNATEFKPYLTDDTFVKWSPKKAGVPLLHGKGSQLIEGHLAQP